ncbi:hypothetical protein B7494_g6098 [Chlorociboria aeruginascens]|nr:hypothetical protein B7494_g6098 [Chlorociboria aeruginascens]
MFEPTLSEMPYLADQPLDLTIIQTFTNLICDGPLRITITKPFEVTQSPVMVVTFNTHSGPMNAILKLYDRRFGPYFRTREGKYASHSVQDEAAWQDYVHRGMANPFFHGMDEDIATSMTLAPEDYHEDSWEGRAQYEGALQLQALQYFNTETETYKRLSELQGLYIPTMLAHVRISQLVPDLPGTEVYFRIPGILIQLIDGWNLSQLADPPNAPSQEKLERIVQMAADTADFINYYGVTMADCHPQNVLVERATDHPFFFDFAQCWFKEEDQDDQSYQEYVSQTRNSAEIGMAMVKQVKEKLGIELNIWYSNLEQNGQ